MSAMDAVPMFLLPNELLKEIFSYVTYISTKMNLEQVSKQIHFVSKQAQSWKGIHKLEMMMKCNVEVHHSEMRGKCSECISLNGIDVPFAKWPAAIKQLLERTHIKELTIHNGCDNESFSSNSNVLPSLIELFQQNTNKMKLKFLECHYNGSDWSPLVINQFCSILLGFLQMSTPYLVEFMSIIE